MIEAALAVLESDEQRNELEAFYKQHKNQFYAVAINYLHNRQDAEDAVQEAFLRIVKYPEKFFNIPSHKKTSYVIIVIKNVIFQILGKKSKISLAEELDEKLIESTVNIENLAVGNILCEELKSFLKTLPEAQKQAIILKINFGLDNSEIAGVLDISDTAARKRISNAYKSISDYLKRRNGDE